MIFILETFTQTLVQFSNTCTTPIASVLFSRYRVRRRGDGCVAQHVLHRHPVVGAVLPVLLVRRTPAVVVVRELVEHGNMPVGVRARQASLQLHQRHGVVRGEHDDVVQQVGRVDALLDGLQLHADLRRQPLLVPHQGVLGVSRLSVEFCFISERGVVHSSGIHVLPDAQLVSIDSR